MLLFAIAGCAIATYLTLYQWHITAWVWDPLFGPDSSERVLTSALSRALPVPDATLGAIAYIVEAAATAVGGEDRWRSAPWVVIAFGLVLAGLALTSCVLALSQIVFVHSLCTLCLGSAGISLVNAGLGRHEVAAALQHLRSIRATP